MSLRVITSVLLMGLVAVLSRFSSGEDPDYGVLRLNWKTVGEKIRVAAAEVQEDTPHHMRAQQDFEEKMRDYQLTATINKRPWLDQLMRPPGLHHDRPISVFEETELAPGRYRVQVKFWPTPAQGATWKPEVNSEVLIEAGVITSLTIGEPGEQR